MHFNIDKHDFKRILVIRFSSLGDIVLTTPVLTALRNKYKDAQIDYLLKEQYADLIRHHPACVNVILLREEVRADSEKFLEFIESLKKNNYNLVIDLQGNARSMIIRRRLGGISVKVNKQTLRRFLTVKFKWGKNKTPSVRKRFFDTLKKIGIETNEIPRTDLGIEVSGLSSIETKYFKETDIKRLAVIHPGASWRIKEWGREKYSILARMLVDHGFTVMMLGLPFDGDPETGMIYVPECSLEELKALIFSSSVFIGNDSGPLHLAVALGIPAVGIFGPTHRSLGYAPPKDEATIVEVELECRPCTLYGAGSCKRGEKICMERIAPEDVFKAVLYECSKSQKNE